MNSIVIQPVSSGYRDSIIDLLKSAKLPVEDLAPDLSNFIVAIDDGFVIGVVGLEVYDHHGLLRSLAVKPEYRNMKVATGLVEGIEKLAKSLGLTGMYLLTETARDYFSRKGYTIINRNEAPASLQQSSEFSHVCPSSAVTMKKVL